MGSVQEKEGRRAVSIPFWQKWLSYLVPLTLETTGSEFNPNLVVRVDRGRVQLLSNHAIYSWDDLYRNFTLAFGRVDLPAGAARDVLVLGFGLGSVPYILEKVYKKNYHYTGVEWDEAVVDLARRYTLDRLQSGIDVVVADAWVFVEVCDEQFDMIVVDIFEDHVTPAVFETEEFLLRCSELLRPGGVLLYNRLYNTPVDKASTRIFYEHTFSALFPGSRAEDTEGNWVLIWEKER